MKYPVLKVAVLGGPIQAMPLDEAAAIEGPEHMAMITISAQRLKEVMDEFVAQAGQKRGPGRPRKIWAKEE